MINTKFELGDIVYWCDRAMSEWMVYPRPCEVEQISVNSNRDGEHFVTYTVRIDLLTGGHRTFKVSEEDCFAAYLECVEEVNRRNGRKKKS